MKFFKNNIFIFIKGFVPRVRYYYKKAFTLAEVLITLGVIGIVAALTMPNIISNHQKMITVNQLKSAYQFFSEVIQQAKFDYNGDGGEIYLTEEELQEVTENSALISKAYFEPYITGVKRYTGKNHIYIYNLDKSSIYSQYMAYPHYQAPWCVPKGYCYWIRRHGGNYTTLYIDLNGIKGPNTIGKDFFVFDLSGTYVPGKGIFSIGLPKPKYDDSLCSKTSTSSNNGKGCAGKIMRDGWQIKDDYPW